MSHINEAPLHFTTNDTHSANATYQAEFAAPVGDSNTNKGIGKADRYAGEMDINNNQYMGLSDKSLRDDESVARDLNLITRSVASSKLSQSLGLNSVVAEAYASSPDGKQVGISAMASGSQLMSNVVDHEGKGPAVIHREFDFSRHDIQKGLYDLEAVDYLSGQIDRHAGNIFINNETGEVEGIDNDLCFGEKPMEAAVRDSAIAAKAVGTPPLFFHEDTAAAIEQMDPAEMVEMLASVSSPDGGHRLTEPEIGAAVERLKTLKASVQVARMEGRVVSKFDEKTLEKAVEHQEKFGGAVAGYEDACCASYVGRSQLQLQRAQELSQNPANGNIVLQPSGPRPLTPYENQLAAHNDKVKEARAAAVGDPSPELQDALDERQAALDELQELDAQVAEKLVGNNSLQSNREIADQAMKAKMANVEKLKACGAHREVGGSSEDGLNAEQAQLINAMVPGVNVEEGDRLTREQWNAIEGKAKVLGRTNVTDARIREVTNQISYVTSAEKTLGIEDKKHEAQQKLAAADKKVAAQVEADPRVQQAVAAKQNFIDTSKPVLIQERDNKLAAQAAEAQLQSDLKFAGELQNQEDLQSLAESVAESNNLPVESLNLMRGGKLQSPAQLRSSAINSRDDAGASKLAGDQMAGTVDHDNLSEGEALAMEGTLSQLGGGSDLEVAKMYARADELNAIADVQAKFGEISKAVNEGQEPTQEQLENFGAAVQVLSECTQKSKLATEAVNESIKTRLQEKLEAKVGPLLDEKGYTPQEKAASIEALADAAMDIDIMKLRDTDERADLYVDQMAEGISQSEFDYPGGNKVHEAVYRAFDATAVAVPDGSIAVKPAGGGQTFNEKRANEHINKALENQGMPVPELPQGQERDQVLAPQMEAGQERIEIYNSKVALEARKTEEVKSLKAHISELEGKKEHLQNHASKGEKFKAILKNGPKGMAAELAKVDKEILAAKKALEVVQSGTGVDQQKADLHQKKGELQAGKQKLDQVNKEIKDAEKVIKKAGLKANLDEAMLGPGLSDKERDNLVRQANAAINVREALKPHAQQLKEAQKDLKAEVKMGEKAVSVRDKVGPKPGQAAIGGHRGGHVA